ncbi:hypothetical protein ADUPG1_000778 [Aduncisulcus paluster]|uniref:Uncharacterized protein n=1 Tax=Aduncisulcus paluster TaxID=2918883 RepID=A0ABQ5K7V6_9EUKA|nr:hypothetical protein ADUPG1_000778 [Aduncisulcus paluster]
MIMALCPSAFALNLEDLEEGNKATPATVAAPDVNCNDDQRLADLNALIAEVKKGPLNKKLILTPERFFKLRPQVIEAIGDQNILICPDISIVNGIPAQRVEIDFLSCFSSTNGQFETMIRKRLNALILVLRLHQCQYKL